MLSLPRVVDRERICFVDEGQHDPTFQGDLQWPVAVTAQAANTECTRGNGGAARQLYCERHIEQILKAPGKS